LNQRSKYYDDCAQILSEHMLAIAKPAALKTFSTLDPLVTTSLNRQTAADLAQVARMLCRRNSEPKIFGSSIGENVVVTDTSSALMNADRSDSGDGPNSAAATLIEGAVPVREFPANMTSGLASICPSGNSSLGGEPPRHNYTNKDMEGTHQEELRCVLAIFRHADRTPKQKLKVNMSEPHILRYFHEQ
jgi:hypothetical protein